MLIVCLYRSNFRFPTYHTDRNTNAKQNGSGEDGDENGGLLCLVRGREREDTAKAAPPDGLFFLGARFRS